MASGDSVTITFNSLILIQALLTWDRVSDFAGAMATVGFSVTNKVSCPYAQPLAIDFLQCRPWLAFEGDRVFAPKPGRILARFFWINKSYAKGHRYYKELKTMVIGLWPLCSHVPIINDLLDNLLQLLRYVQPSRKKFEGPAEIIQWFVGSSRRENPATMLEMTQLYNLDFEELELVRERCRKWNFDGPLDNTEGLSAAFSKIACTDLE